MTLILFFLENKHLMEPLLLISQEEDKIEMGAEAHSSFIKHLKEIRQQAEKEFGQENIFSETEAQDVMIGVGKIMIHLFFFLFIQMFIWNIPSVPTLYFF